MSPWTQQWLGERTNNQTGCRGGRAPACISAAAWAFSGDQTSDSVFLLMSFCQERASMYLGGSLGSTRAVGIPTRKMRRTQRRPASSDSASSQSAGASCSHVQNCEQQAADQGVTSPGVTSCAQAPAVAPVLTAPAASPQARRARASRTSRQRIGCRISLFEQLCPGRAGFDTQPLATLAAHHARWSGLRGTRQLFLSVPSSGSSHRAAALADVPEQMAAPSEAGSAMALVPWGTLPLLEPCVRCLDTSAACANGLTGMAVLTMTEMTTSRWWGGRSCCSAAARGPAA